MTRLDRPIEDYDPRGRNLFQYYTPPPREPDPTPPPIATPIPTPFPTPPPERFERPSAPVQPRPPQVGFTLLGVLGPKDRKIAIFEIASNMVLAQQGEVVQQQFRLEGFGYESVILGYTDERFQGQTTELKLIPGSRKR
jgi:hypothetical protein